MEAKSLKQCGVPFFSESQFYLLKKKIRQGHLSLLD